MAEVFGMVGEKLQRFWPEGGERLRIVVYVDREAISLAVVGHVPEHVIVDGTKQSIEICG